MTRKARSSGHILNGCRNSEKKSVYVWGRGRGDIRQDFQLKCRISAKFTYATLPAHLTFLDFNVAAMNGQRDSS